MLARRGTALGAHAVPVAYYSHYDTKVRPLMPSNPSRCAPWSASPRPAPLRRLGNRTQQRPTNERLAADTGYP